MSLFDTAAMRLFLKPGMALMRGLRFPAKITLMAIVLLAPLSWLTGQALLASHASLEATRLEARGNPLLRLSLDVIAQVQKHRGSSIAGWQATRTSKANLSKPVLI